MARGLTYCQAPFLYCAGEVNGLLLIADRGQEDFLFCAR